MGKQIYECLRRINPVLFGENEDENNEQIDSINDHKNMRSMSEPPILDVCTIQKTMQRLPSCPPLGSNRHRNKRNEKQNRNDIENVSIKRRRLNQQIGKTNYIKREQPDV